MANYYCKARTNYFHVTDEDAYRELFSHLISDEGDLEDFTKEKDGRLLHGFGSYGQIGYCYVDADGDEDISTDQMFHEIQKLLPDDECFVYIETGHEKLCYLSGFACICTKNEVKSVELNNWIEKQAKELGTANYCASY